MGNGTIYNVVRTPDVSEIIIAVASIICGLIILVRPVYQRLYEEVLWLSVGIWAATAVDLTLDGPYKVAVGRIRGGAIYSALTLVTFALYLAEYGYRKRQSES